MLEPIPCPVGKCNAQIYNVTNENLVFCPKCLARNPNYRRSRPAERTTTARIKNKPESDLKSGTIKW